MILLVKFIWMKAFKIFVPGFLLLGMSLVIAAVIYARQKSLNKNAEQGFAVVELFTSEGCSSCPPADELVARIEKENSQNHIYILSYHVDYWDRLGWKDRFSDAVYTKRQNLYADWFNLQSIYTPQIVVNGKTEFVGSNEAALRKAIDEGLKQSSTAGLSLKAIVENGKIDISYQVEGKIKNSELVIALVLKSAQTKVSAGENAGHMLSHVQIVKTLQAETLHLNSGTISLALPPDYNDTKFELIGFVQNETRGDIQSAARSVLTSH